jgi:hypothetical protein
MKRDHWLYLLAVAAGAAVWIAVSAASGRREAWDSSLYFSLGVPVICVLSLVLALLSPARPWRWGVLPLAGQFVAMLVSQGPGNLLPLGVIVFGVLSLPSVATAWLGAWLAAKWKRGSAP